MSPSSLRSGAGRLKNRRVCTRVSPRGGRRGVWQPGQPLSWPGAPWLCQVVPALGAPTRRFVRRRSILAAQPESRALLSHCLPPLRPRQPEALPWAGIAALSPAARLLPAAPRSCRPPARSGALGWHTPGTPMAPWPCCAPACPWGCAGV